jgi:hypothetical protein
VRLGNDRIRVGVRATVRVGVGVRVRVRVQVMTRGQPMARVVLKDVNDTTQPRTRG